MRRAYEELWRLSDTGGVADKGILDNHSVHFSKRSLQLHVTLSFVAMTCKMRN